MPRATVASTGRNTVALSAPQRSGGMPLLTALQQRRSVRAYEQRPLPRDVLSNLLWACFGINRPESGDRMAPYWRHVMVIDVYLAMADGVWIYEPKSHTLQRCTGVDIRHETGDQDFVAGAPLELIYVAHGERMDIPAEERRLYASVDAAFIGENVYLFCASEGLGSVFRGSFDGAKLARRLVLEDQQFVAFVQTVGYPAA
jgi:nitroreductase